MSLTLDFRVTYSFQITTESLIVPCVSFQSFIWFLWVTFVIFFPVIASDIVDKYVHKQHTAYLLYESL